MYLKINGVTLDVADASLDYAEIGSTVQGYDGSTFVDRRRLLRSLDFSTPLMTMAASHTLATLLWGEGHHWSFDDTTNWAYSSKGLYKTSGTGTVTASGGKFDGYITLGAGATVTWTLSGYTEYTLMVWYYTGGAWHHYAVRSDGGKWVDGVRNDMATIAFLDVTSDVLTLGDSGSGATQDFDDLVVLPCEADDSFMASWGIMTSAFSELPLLNVTGTSFADATILAVGSDVQMSDQFAAIGGVWQLVRTVSALLTETPS